MNVTTTIRPLDHMRLVRRRRTEVERFQRLFRDVVPGISDLTILHEADDSCCKREPWLTTFAQLFPGATRRPT